MRTTVSSREQTAVPAEVRRRFKLGENSRLEWIIDAYASFMTYMEVLYRVWRLGGQTGKAAYLRLKALAIHRLDVSEDLLLAAGRLKARQELSVADAWIATTAVLTRSRLVHKDPEFRPLVGEISLLELPIKPRAAR